MNLRKKLLLSIQTLLLSLFFLGSIVGVAGGADLPTSVKDSSIKIEKFQVSPEEGGPIHIDLRGFWEKAPFEIQGSLGSFQQMFNPKIGWPISLRVKLAQIRLEISGTIREPKIFRGVDLKVRGEGGNLAELGKLLSKPLPEIEAFTLSANLTDLGEKRFELSEIDIRWEKNDLGGTVKLDLRKDKPRITAELSSQLLDFRKSSLEKRPSAEKKSSPSKGGNKRVFSEKPFDLEALNLLNMDLKYRAKKVLIPGFAFNNVQVAANIVDGRLLLDPVTSRVGGGTLDGALSVEPKGKNTAITAILSVNGLRLERMQKELDLDSLGQGKFDLDMDLGGIGGSPAELMGALDGNISMIMNKGRIDKDYLRVLKILETNLMSSVMSILNIPSTLKKSKPYTEINCFVVRLDVTGGMAQITALVFDTPLMSLVGNGNIDLATEKLDIHLKPFPKEGFGAEGLGKLNISLSELAKPFKLGGTLANPNVAVDATQTAITIGKAIGGAALFGPAGIAVALLSGNLDKNADNPCVKAVEAARSGVKVPKEKSGVMKKVEDFIDFFSP